MPVVVAINHFPTDTEAEVALVRAAALRAGAADCVVSRIFAEGGAGGLEMAEAVVRAAEQGARFRHLYDVERPIKEKIETIATRVYGAGAAEYTTAASRAIRDYTRLGYDKLPVCMAKTHLSLSGDPNLKGRPSGFTVVIRDVLLSAGAGFVYPLVGQMMTMPGLGSAPGGLNVDIDEAGRVVGLS